MGEYAMVANLPRSKAINLSFENISFKVPSQGFRKGTEKQILKSLSGEFRSGELTAVMGPSGAGKSSFLNILSGFRSHGMQGCIYRNGISNIEKAGMFKKSSCYIMQDDFLNPMFTVGETMLTAAHLKLGINTSEKGKQLMIDNILESLSLIQTKDTRCKKLSGGQRKRLSIALELLDNPSVMFLDEPTTGLDSLSTLQCLRVLKGLARNGRTIVCTIHQPSATMFEMFDHVYMLSEGVCIYQGSSKNAIPYFAHVGLPCPQYHSIADYMAEIAAGDYGNFLERLSQAAQDSRWRAPAVTMKVDDVSTKWPTIPDRPPSEFTKVWILINRNLLQLHRDWIVTHIKLVAHFLVATILGLSFKNIGDDGSKTINNVGFVFCSIIYLSYTSMMPAVLRFPSEIAIVRKEKFNNWYNLRTYYIAFLTTNTPIQLFLVLVFVSVSYYLTAQPWDLARFSMYMVICMLTVLTAESLGHYMGTFGGILYGLCLSSAVIALLLVFSGCLALYPHMPTYMYVISFICFGRYSFHGLILALYGNDRDMMQCPEELSYCHLRLPERLLKELGVEDGTFWTDIVALTCMLLFLRTVAFISLKRKVVYG